MSKPQDLIAYQRSLETVNNVLIDQLNQQIVGFNTQITQLQAQIDSNNTLIAAYRKDSGYIADTVPYIPPDSSDIIDYQYGIMDKKTDSIRQLVTQNSNISNDIVYAKNQINILSAQIVGLQQDNVWIENTISMIPPL